MGGGYYYPNFSNEEPETQRADSLDERGRLWSRWEGGLEWARRGVLGHVVSVPGLLLRGPQMGQGEGA